MKRSTPSPSKRGRPSESERDDRRRAALNAALAEIVEHGYESTTMLAVARRAGSSKESLYTWFGTKEGLINSLIALQSERTNSAVTQALDSDSPPDLTLTRLASGLLGIMLSKESIALNRAAMSSPSLADALLQGGRHTTGPLIERYLTKLDQQGIARIPDARTAFGLFYGLVIQDSQIRALLGEAPLSAEERTERCDTAVATFGRLHAIETTV